MALALENPTLLQSVLAVAPLDDGELSWKFVRASGVLPPSAEVDFRTALAHERARGEVTGPQLFVRVASALGHLATPAGHGVDHRFARAKELWSRFRAEVVGGAEATPPPGGILDRMKSWFRPGPSPRPSAPPPTAVDPDTATVPLPHGPLTVNASAAPLSPTSLSPLSPLSGPVVVTTPGRPLSRPAVSQPVLHLIRTWSWKTLLEEVDHDPTDLTALKLRTFAFYVRRRRVGAEYARNMAEQLLAVPTLSPAEQLYVRLMMAELTIACGLGPSTWRPHLEEARLLAHAGAITTRDDLDFFTEALKNLETVNLEITPMGPVLEQMGFWSSVHLRAFFGLPPSFTLDSTVGMGTGVSHTNLGSGPIAPSTGSGVMKPTAPRDASASPAGPFDIRRWQGRLHPGQKRVLGHVLNTLELKAAMVRPGAEAQILYGPAELGSLRRSLSDDGGDDDLRELLFQLGEQILCPADLVRVRDALAEIVGRR